jgi:parvulin-like peptidyl-prolyl isomerase
MRDSAVSVVLVFWAVLGIVAPGRSEIVDRVAAVVNGEVIALSMVEDAMNAIWTDPQEVPESQQDALEKLIDHKLMLQEAMKLGVIVSEESLSREVTKVASRFGSPEKLSEALRQRGITQEDLEENLREQIKVREMVNRKFRLFAEATEGEASEFFEQHKEEFVMPEAVHLNQIFFGNHDKLGNYRAASADRDAGKMPALPDAAKEAARKRAEEVFKKLKNGADFSRYASEEGTADYVAVDQLIPAVAAAISRLKVGEISDTIETSIGYFIIKLNDRRPARHASFGEVKEEIKASLLQQKTDDELQAWLKRQRELADIRVKVEFSDE